MLTINPPYTFSKALNNKIALTLHVYIIGVGKELDNWILLGLCRGDDSGFSPDGAGSPRTTDLQELRQSRPMPKPFPHALQQQHCRFICVGWEEIER